MTSINRVLIDEIYSGLGAMSINRNKHKVSVFVHLEPDQDQINAHGLTHVNHDNTVFGYNIHFERDDNDDPWRLVTPINIID